MERGASRHSRGAHRGELARELPLLHTHAGRDADNEFAPMVEEEKRDCRMNFKDNNPIYLQIAERICDEILQGRYSEDDRIPSVREYAAMVEVNANTVVRTFDHLQSLEVIYNKRGLGYFVAKGAVRRITKERKRTFLTEELPELFRKMDTLKISIDELRDIYNNRE